MKRSWKVSNPCHAKLIEVHPSNISLHLLLAEIFNFSIFAGTYHGQRVATLVLCGANQLEPQNPVLLVGIAEDASSDLKVLRALLHSETVEVLYAISVFVSGLVLHLLGLCCFDLFVVFVSNTDSGINDFSCIIYCPFVQQDSASGVAVFSWHGSGTVMPALSIHDIARC